MSGKPTDPKSAQSTEAADSKQPADSKGISRRAVVTGGFAAGAAALLFSRKASAAALTTATSSAAGATSVYRIHPSIGIARVGNADPSTFFIGPEVPGQGPSGDAPGTPAGPFKVGGLLKPQAARFRVFEYQNINGRLTPVREVTLATPGVAQITWSVHLANKKASFHRFAGPAGEGANPAGGLRNAAVTNRGSLEVDLGARSIGGASQGPAEFRVGTSGNPASETYPVGPGGAPVIDYLGQVRTDASGRLIVIGGQGKAAYNTNAAPPLGSYANNDGWFDDISDGPVTATVTLDGGVQVPVNGANGAWVLCTPPDFAPGVAGSITLYDLAYDLGIRSIAIPAANALYDAGGPLARFQQLKSDFQPNAEIEFPTTTAGFVEEINPVWNTAYRYRWVTALVTAKHDSLILGNLDDSSAGAWKLRNAMFQYIRTALGATTPGSTGTMPHLLGDDPYNAHQPESVRNLALTRTQFGLMRRWMQGNFIHSLGTPAPTGITPHGLDRAALESGSGGAFFPGIEAGWQIRNPGLWAEPFRLNLAATSGYYGEAGQPLLPGHFSRQMALPWHADFNDCRTEGGDGWWPSQRPTDVFATPGTDLTKRVDWSRPDSRYPGGNLSSTHPDMIANWYKFGFVVEQNGLLFETERAAQVP